jgi:hypothetical protein
MDNLNKIWDILSKNIKLLENAENYSIVGLKNFYKDTLGFANNKKMKKNTVSRSPGFSYAIHIKILVKLGTVINIMFFVGSGVFNVTGTVNLDELNIIMKYLFELLYTDYTLYYFIKIHMDKVVINFNKSIYYERLKLVIDNDTYGYKITKTGNIATIQNELDFAAESYDLNSYSGDLWQINIYTLLEINEMFLINSNKIKKEMDLNVKKCNIRIVVELNKNKLIFCSKSININNLIIEDFLMLLDEKY